ncbi:hypothetical protein CVT26_001093 [Gymnopilus dilepis]|uniref:Uncharacterized protein n=1 Tax=Gymnopilus dilepis TaxID=231916 RepID=A0A409WL93_9AGAR|nr:hypothetical protein CVT26_001093 [Gymnopilus dilepis]
MRGLYQLLEHLNLLNRDRHLYRPVANLAGHRGPINALSFSPCGYFLASGSDDEEIRVWNINNPSPSQILLDPARQWGQITAVRFVQLDINALGSEWLCFGTGRGQFAIYRKLRRATEFVEVLSIRVFSTGDGVESFAFDQYNQRFAVSSHYGKVKMLRFEKGNLIELWADELFDAIPRAIFFSDKGQVVSVVGMENGTLYNRDAETSVAKSTKVLKTPAGHIGTCSATANMLVDNMRDGFDVYSPGRPGPIHKFRVHSTRRYVKGCEFGEGGKVAVCGSDHGKIYIFGLQNDCANQELAHGNPGRLIQTVQGRTTISLLLVAQMEIMTSPSGKSPQVIRTRVKRDEKPDITGILLLSNAMFFLILAWMTQDIWAAPISIHLSSMARQLHRLNSFPSERQTPSKQEIPDVNLILQGLDDATLRRLLRVPSNPILDLQDRQIAIRRRTALTGENNNVDLYTPSRP